MKEEIKIFKALSDETRLRILALLSTKELCVCQIEKTLNIPQAKISRHLMVLKHSGMARDRRSGLWVFYSLAKPRNALERVLQKTLKDYFIKKHSICKKDFIKLKKCESKLAAKCLATRR